MPLSAGLNATLVAASAVELYAGASLTFAPQRFVRKTYGVRGPLDPLTLKFARYACALTQPTCTCLRFCHRANCTCN